MLTFHILSHKTLLRIHDIFVWIRIRIRGSMPLTNRSGSGFGSGSGCGSGSFYFHHWPSNLEKKILHITFWRYFYIMFKGKMSKRSHKTVEIKVFLLFCLMIEGFGAGCRRPKNTWIRWIWIRIRIRIRNTANKCPESQDFIACFNMNRFPLHTWTTYICNFKLFINLQF